MKKEMLAAGRAGDEERAEEDDPDSDNLFDEKDGLTKEGRAIKKLLMRKENDVYSSDDDVKNPYAFEVSLSLFFPLYRCLKDFVNDTSLNTFLSTFLRRMRG